VTVLRSGSASDVGRVRSVNEDRLLETGSLFAVADGMGGHAGGEVAAGIAVDVLERTFRTNPSLAGLVEAVQRANAAVWERSLRDAEVRGMGTTLIATALVATGEGDRLVVVNVGDSRAYRYVGGRLEQMTTDHSVAEELVARGELSEAEAAVHPQRHILTRALGVGPDVDVDTWEVTPAEGERYVLCSDGLTNEVSEDRIAEVLAEVRDPRRAARRLVAMANEHGGNDNITVVVLDVVVADAHDGPSEAVGREVDADAARAARATPGGRSAGTMVDRAAAGPADAPAGGTTQMGTAQMGTVGVGTVGVGTEDRPTVRVSSRPAGAGRPAADDPERDEPPEMLARHVTAALSEVMGRQRSPRSRTDRAAGVVSRRPTRRLTPRVALFFVMVLAVLAGAVAVVRYYAEDAWYVRFDGGRVAVYQGRPGGFLGFDPHVVQVTDLTAHDVLAYRVPELRSGVTESSRQAADQFVANLKTEFCAAQPQAAVCGSPPATGTGAAA
jgi:protein phosphatase